MGESRKIVVISAVNFFSGGPLTILKDCVTNLSNFDSSDFHFLILVHKRDLIKDTQSNIEVVEFPLSRKSWFLRLYYEYIYFFFFSIRFKPYLWLSLHDITPNVIAKKRAVYCHNPSPFYEISQREVKLDRIFALFNKLYLYLYSINIKKNNFVIVQQEWLRNVFIKKFELKNVIVTNPENKRVNQTKFTNEIKSVNDVIFSYPALPRVFKNHEIIAEAVRILYNRNIQNFQVNFTIDGLENDYAEYILKKYKFLKSINFLGLLKNDEMTKLYSLTDFVIFPSKLETWGLPITEAKAYHIPILLADLPYAKETVGTYDFVKFFKVNDPNQLADIMQSAIKGNIIYEPTQKQKPIKPFAENWSELFNILLKE